MSDSQILAVTLASVPTMIAVLIGILLNNSRLSDVQSHLRDLRSHMDDRFAHVDARFNHVDHRFEEMKEMWRSELHRVEEVLDARLKHLEER